MVSSLYLVVEGTTENIFCERFLKPYFNSKNIDFLYHTVKTSRDDNGTGNRGGLIKIEKLKEELKIVNNPNYLVSMFIDYYKCHNPEKYSIDKLESIFKDHFNKNNFIPYFQQYEAETLLFCSPEITTKYLKDLYSNKNEERQIFEMQRALKENNYEPEKINNSSITAPSKRIKAIFSNYDKANGEFANIVKEIGIDEIKNQCPRFRNWLDNIESVFNK